MSNFYTCCAQKTRPSFSLLVACLFPFMVHSANLKIERDAQSLILAQKTTQKNARSDDTKTLSMSPEMLYSTYLYMDQERNLGSKSIAIDSEDNVILIGTRTENDVNYISSITKLGPNGSHIDTTELRGNRIEDVNAVTTDSAGNVIITGITASNDFPVTPGASQPLYAGNSDAFIEKFDPEGHRLFATYLGGTGYDSGYSVTVDNEDNIIVTGETLSNDFPITPNAIRFSSYSRPQGDRDIFITKFNPNGVMVYSTYLGGEGSEIGLSVATDSEGNIIVTGLTNSHHFLVTPTAFQLAPPSPAVQVSSIITKINNPSNTVDSTVIMFSSYLSGSDNTVLTRDLVVDSEDNIIITGTTGSTHFPVTQGAFQTTYPGGQFTAFLSKFSPTGSLLYSSYLGGENVDRGNGVAVDSDNNIFVTGSTNSSNFPLTPTGLQTNYADGYEDAYISQFSPDGTLLYSSYLGGSGFDHGRGIVVDSEDKVIVKGATSSKDFPITPNAYHTDFLQSYVFNYFVSKLSVD